MPYTFAIRFSQRYAKNCKRVCLAKAHFGTERDNRKNQAERGKHYAEQTTEVKNKQILT